MHSNSAAPERLQQIRERFDRGVELYGPDDTVHSTLKLTTEYQQHLDVGWLLARLDAQTQALAKLSELRQEANHDMQMFAIQHLDPVRKTRDMERHRTLCEIAELFQRAAASGPWSDPT